MGPGPLERTVSGRKKGRHFCVGGMASLCMMAGGGYRRGHSTSIPRWQISGLGLQLTLVLQGGHAQRTCESLHDRGPMGLQRQRHQPEFEFLCFASLPLLLKNGFSVWSKLVKAREHLYRERCSWHACAVPFMLLRSVSVQCFCLLVFLMAQFPLYLPKSVMETVHQ